MRNRPYPLYDVPQVRSLKEVVDQAAEKYGARPAFSYAQEQVETTVTYLQFQNDVKVFSKALQTLHHDQRGIKIAVIGENSYVWILTYFAVVNSGNIIVPIDRDMPPVEVHRNLKGIGVETLVYSTTYLDIANYLQKEQAGIQNYIGMSDLLKLPRCQGENNAQEYQVDSDAVCTILFTSGTTATSKGVMLTHKGIAIDAMSACRHVLFSGSNLLLLPLHHAFAFTAGVVAALLEGSRIFINTSLKRVYADFQRFRPNNIFVVPLFVESFYNGIYATARKKGKDRSLRSMVRLSNALRCIGIDIRRMLFRSVCRSFGGNLKMIVSGGAPIDAKYIQGLTELGILVLNGYGITECSPIVSVNRNRHYRVGSVGVVLPGCEVRISAVDEQGYGEICVKGDIVMAGYFNDAIATAEAFDGEWFMTGDIGYMDADGFLYITGRKNNLIVLSNGKNIQPEAIEHTLSGIPFVKEVIVRAGQISQRHAQILVAEIYPDYDGLRASQMESPQQYFEQAIAMMNKTAPPYMHIQRTIIRETEFPKTTTKKIKRNTEG